MLTPARVKEIRARFPVFREKIYLNSCSQGALSDSVRAGLDAYAASWDRYGSPWDIWVDEYEKGARRFREISRSQDGRSRGTSQRVRRNQFDRQRSEFW